MIHSIKRLTVFVLLLVLVSSCFKPEQPEFRSIEDVTFQNFSMENVTVEAKVVLYNPNNYSLTIVGSDILMAVEDKEVGQVSIIGEGNVEIGKKTDFKVPLRVTFPPSKLFDNVFTGLMTYMNKEKIEVSYYGTVDVEVMGVGFTVPVKQKASVKLK